MHTVFPAADLCTLKKELRKELKKRLRDYSGKKEESLWLLREIQRSQVYQEASVILAFSPLPSEPDISPLLDDPRILLPYIVDGEMKFAQGGNLQKNELGFLEPVVQEEVSYDKALMLVPMLGFDRTNLRLGRGGGYYDKYIASHKAKLYTMGVAYSVSLVDEVPVEWNDLRLDTIIHP